jgi:hypothetical protein
MADSLKKARHSNTTVHGRMLRTHVTDALHMTGSSTFFSSDLHHDWCATHCLWVTWISPPSAARQIKQYRRQNEFYSGVTAKCYTWLAIGGTHYQWLQIGDGRLDRQCTGKHAHHYAVWHGKKIGSVWRLKCPWKSKICIQTIWFTMLKPNEKGLFKKSLDSMEIMSMSLINYQIYENMI